MAEPSKDILYSDQITDTYCILVEIQHAYLTESICVATALEDVIALDQAGVSRTWLAAQVQVKLPTKTNQLKSAEVTVQNVDSRIGEAAQQIYTPCSVFFRIVRAEDPDTIEAEFPPLVMSQINGTAVSVTGSLTSSLNRDEPWPKQRATKTLAPAIFTDALVTYGGP